MVTFGLNHPVYNLNYLIKPIAKNGKHVEGLIKLSDTNEISMYTTYAVISF